MSGKMIRKFIYFLVITTVLPLEAMKDQDFDGVADEVDECPKTAFFEKVDAHGCTVEILTLPNETEENGLQLLLGYGVIVNEDLLGRDEQKIETLKMSYYRDNWSYSLGSGYYQYKETKGTIDTTLKVKKRLSLTSTLKFNVGVGIKFPTYNFKGNRTDYALYSAVNYYPKKSLSLFGSYSHTFVQDESVNSALRDSEYFSGGVGYFFTKQFYTNLVFSVGENKFVSQHPTESLSSTLYYKFNQQWFSLLQYNQEIRDESEHRTYTVKVGYKIW